MILIIADANAIISALIGGVSREIFFNPHYIFATTNHAIKEVEKYIPHISEKTGLGIELLQRSKEQ